MIVIILLAVTSCKGLRPGVGVRCINCDNGMITLDEDTFQIRESIGDSLLIVRRYPEEIDEQDYLLKLGSNGFYYLQLKAHSISSISNTLEYVCLDDTTVYRLSDKSSFLVPCDMSCGYYLGQWKDKVVLTNRDSICFSDGKCVALQEEACCFTSDMKGYVNLILEGRNLELSLGDLYHYKSKAPSARHIGEQGLLTERKVVDCTDYTTCYKTDTCEGLLHEIPISYYRTYDKKRKVYLTAANIVKPSMMKQFREYVLKSIKRQYDRNHQQPSVWDNFLQVVFDFHSIGRMEMNTLEKDDLSLNPSLYNCDKWSGWGNVSAEAFTLDNFPLPHLAVLPEGIVVSYHPYQIDCFASGEYHAVIPFSQANPYLLYQYVEYTEGLPKLEMFVK